MGQLRQAPDLLPNQTLVSQKSAVESEYGAAFVAWARIQLLRLFDPVRREHGTQFLIVLRLSFRWRISGNPEPQTHKNWKPVWIHPDCEFRQVMSRIIGAAELVIAALITVRHWLPRASASSLESRCLRPLMNMTANLDDPVLPSRPNQRT